MAKGRKPILEGTIRLMKNDLRHFEVGKRFYTKKQAAEKYGVSIVTAGLAMHSLAVNGYLVQAAPNHCFYVKEIWEKSHELNQ